MYEIFDKFINFITKAMKNLESEIKSKVTNISWGENPERLLPKRFVLATNTCNYNYDTYLNLYN